MNEINPLLEKLHDIAGLDPIPLWPLAIGWWIVIGFGTIMLLLAALGLTRWLKFRRSWKYDTLEKLEYLSQTLSQPTVSNMEIQHTATFFSEYLRRIALRRFSRSACAGLTGQAWLEWLTKHDSKNFDWVKHGKSLIQAPYAPAHHRLAPEQLKILIQAAKEWVR
jgi:hypothetical protein